MRIPCVFEQYSLHVAADEARQRGFLAVERAVICGLIIARLNFPPLQGLRKHTHTHTYMHVYTLFSLLHIQSFLPLSSSCMRFPDVFPVSLSIPSRLKLREVVELPVSDPQSDL